MTYDDTARETPNPVIASIAAGVAPLPFLLVYSVIFIGHGVFYPVQPPDITSSRTGEAIAGFTAIVIALVLIWTVWWFLNGRRRWTFVLGQLAILATSIDFVVDSTKGSRTIPAVLILTSAIALGYAFRADSWDHVGRDAPRIRRAPSSAHAQPTSDAGAG